MLQPSAQWANQASEQPFGLALLRSAESSSKRGLLQCRGFRGAWGGLFWGYWFGLWIVIGLFHHKFTIVKMFSAFTRVWYKGHQEVVRAPIIKQCWSAGLCPQNNQSTAKWRTDVREWLCWLQHIITQGWKMWCVVNFFKYNFRRNASDATFISMCQWWGMLLHNED